MPLLLAASPTAFVTGVDLSTVAIAARTRADLDAAAKAIEARGARAVVLPLDITDEHAVQRAFAELKAVSPARPVIM